MRRPLVLIGLIAAAVILALGTFTLYMSLVQGSGITRGFDNTFGEQHLKTTVALVDLHKVRYGSYPQALSQLRFIGDWDRLARPSSGSGRGSTRTCDPVRNPDYFDAGAGPSGGNT
jgi:hypothetical protein